MSILIKNMNMPCDCDDCFFCLETGICAALLASTPTCGDVSDWRYRQGEIPPFCPLVLVPPHGRLIDADALAAKDNNDFKKIIKMADPATVFGIALADAHTAIQEFIKYAPTIIEAEEGE